MSAMIVLSPPRHASVPETRTDGIGSNRVRRRMVRMQYVFLNSGAVWMIEIGGIGAAPAQLDSAASPAV
jgi:hypothetical protein